MSHLTPLGAIARGVAAGVVGTAVMTGCQELSMKLQSSGEDGGSGGGQDTPQDPWEQASVPAKVGRRIIEGVFQKEVPPERIGLLTNVMHWGYGTTWGAVYGLLQGSGRGPALRSGLVFGTGVWAASYLQLVPMGLYQPPWEYSPKDTAMELSYHWAYGAGVGAAFAALDR